MRKEILGFLLEHSSLKLKNISTEFESLQPHNDLFIDHLKCKEKTALQLIKEN